MFRRVAPLRLQRLARLCLLLALALWGRQALAQPAAAFDFDTLTALAREQAGQPWRPAPAALPPALAALDYDGARRLRHLPDRAIWRDAALPFELMVFARSKDFAHPVELNELLPGGQVRPLRVPGADFDTAAAALEPAALDAAGIAGWRAHVALNTPDYKDELVVFLGASYFRALGAGQQYGLSARGLAIDTVGGEGPEEFPRFSRFWVARPAPDARELTVYALLESARATGAFRFVVRPGRQTVMQVAARVFLREGVERPVRTLGIAPLTSMFLAGENQPRAGDFRPEVHDADGLMVATGGGEWLWRPLHNPARMLVNSFAVDSLRGFGLMQRDRAFASYEDTEARYERRPSAWVRPLGDWGPGRVELVQLPTPDETQDNIVAYWVPARLPAPGQALELAYELAWQGDEQQRPPAAWVRQTRVGFGWLPAQARTDGLVQYHVDFEGPALAALGPGAPVRAVATADGNAVIDEINTHFNPATSTWRMALRVRRLDPARPVELRAFLRHGNDTLSETWTNIILPDPAR